MIELLLKLLFLLAIIPANYIYKYWQLSNITYLQIQIGSSIIVFWKNSLNFFLLNEKKKNLFNHESFFIYNVQCYKAFPFNWVYFTNNFRSTECFYIIHHNQLIQFQICPKFLQFCKQIKDINNPFEIKSPNRSRKRKKINSIIQEIDDQIK